MYINNFVFVFMSMLHKYLYVFHIYIYKYVQHTHAYAHLLFRSPFSGLAAIPTRSRTHLAWVSARAMEPTRISPSRGCVYTASMRYVGSCQHKWTGSPRCRCKRKYIDLHNKCMEPWAISHIPPPLLCTRLLCGSCSPHCTGWSLDSLFKTAQENVRVFSKACQNQFNMCDR